MHNSKIVLLINDDVRLIKGAYDEGATPEVFKTMDQGIVKDDFCVVESGTRHGMTTVKVTEVDIDIDFDSHHEVKWVVQRINKEDFDDLLAMEKNAIIKVQEAEKRRRKAELRDSLFRDHEDQMKTLELTKLSEDSVTE